MPRVVYKSSEFETKGETREFRGRSFCPKCGSRLFSADEQEAEIKLGILSEAPTPLRPAYELWVKRCEDWLAPIDGAEQFDQDRTGRSFIAHRQTLPPDMTWRI